MAAAAAAAAPSMGQVDVQVREQSNPIDALAKEEIKTMFMVQSSLSLSCRSGGLKWESASSNWIDIKRDFQFRLIGN